MIQSQIGHQPPHPPLRLLPLCYALPWQLQPPLSCTGDQQSATLRHNSQSHKIGFPALILFGHSDTIPYQKPTSPILWVEGWQIFIPFPFHGKGPEAPAMSENKQDRSSRSRKHRFIQTLHLLISHHEPPYMHRCWRLTLRGHTLYVCARCSALLLGILVAILSQFLIVYIEVTPLTFLLAFLVSLPAAIDWSTQTLGLRESRNLLRALTGFLLGLAVGFVLSSLNIIYYLLVVILYSGYTLGFGAIAPRLQRRIQRRAESQTGEGAAAEPAGESAVNRTSTSRES